MNTPTPPDSNTPFDPWRDITTFLKQVVDQNRTIAEKAVTALDSSNAVNADIVRTMSDAVTGLSLAVGAMSDQTAAIKAQTETFALLKADVADLKKAREREIEATTVRKGDVVWRSAGWILATVVALILSGVVGASFKGCDANALAPEVTEGVEWQRKDSGQ